MDRVHYRRVSPPRHARQERGYTRGTHYSNDSDHITAGETIITQCVISGVIMVAVLLISMLDVAPAATLRAGLRQALTGSTTLGELVTDVRYFSEEWLGWNAAETHTPQNYIPQIQEPTEIIPLPPAVIPEAAAEYLPPLTAYDEPSNPQIPGPSAVPGLWD